MQNAEAKLVKMLKLSYNFLHNSPERIFWKAASTLVESKAEVSMNDNSFLSGKKLKTHLDMMPQSC